MRKVASWLASPGQHAVAGPAHDRERLARHRRLPKRSRRRRGSRRRRRWSRPGSLRPRRRARTSATGTVLASALSIDEPARRQLAAPGPRTGQRRGAAARADHLAERVNDEQDRDDLEVNLPAAGEVSLQRRGHRPGHREQEQRLDGEPPAAEFAPRGASERPAERARSTSSVRTG